MKDFPIIISFFSKDTLYEKEAQGLIDSCKKFDLEHQVDAIPTLGSWEKNCCFKPKYILEIIKWLKRDVLWVDADALFVKNPGSFDLDCDFAARIDQSNVFSGTVYVKYSEEGLEILDLWEKECLFQLTKSEREKEVWDQTCLKNVLEKPHKARVKSLPVEYCRIADEASSKPLHESIILHFQASRLLKKIIHGEVHCFSGIEKMSSVELKELRGFAQILSSLK